MDKNCKGCRLRDPYRIIICNMDHIERGTCPCKKCIVKGMCDTYCGDFIEYLTKEFDCSEEELYLFNKTSRSRTYALRYFHNHMSEKQILVFQKSMVVKRIPIFTKKEAAHRLLGVRNWGNGK